MQPQLLERVAPEIGALAWGDPEAPLVIAVHGFPDTAWTWRHLGPELAGRGWRVVAPFTRGYAPSALAPGGGYDLGTLVADIVAIRAALSPDRPVMLVGHDWGGAIVSAVAASAPAGFGGAAILAIPPLPTILDHLRRPRPAALARFLRQAPRSWYMALFQVPGLAERVGHRLFGLLWRLWAPGYDSTSDRALLHASLPTTARRAAAISYYRAVVNPAYRSSCHAGLRRAAFGPPRLPTLYLHGAADTCGRVELGLEAERHLPAGSRRVVVPGAGHFLHLERPDAVNELIRTWLDRPDAVTREESPC
ncbi:alpha/beta fold hydrolase [Nocardia sp. NPDC050697]|uniref:alpha/beta fold hydrolase n=1 Tax=Nocardia sp. NPDC050697 TaxID=3155158 RepID=UPI0033C1D953